MKDFQVVKLFGLRLSLTPLFFLGTFLLWAALSVVGVVVLKFGLYQAILAGLAGTLSHWLASLVHNLGHAVAARETGYPMTGIRLGVYFFLGASHYPENEPQLPPETHIRRALGGPVASSLFSILLGLVTLVALPEGGVGYWLALFAFVSSFLVFTLGPFLPLGFTDGSTLLRWWGRH